MDANDLERNHWRSVDSSSLREPLDVGAHHDEHRKSREQKFEEGGESKHLLRESEGPQSSGEEEMVSEYEMTDDEESGLASLDKARRKRRKPADLRERVAGGGKPLENEQKLADLNVLKNSAVNALLIGLWYLFSLSISIYNKWMFDPKHLDFHFPLFTTCMHMLVQFTLASTVLYFIPRFRPRPDSISNPHNHKTSTHEDPSDRKKSLMSAKFYLTRIGPCGAATGLDIGLGNMSLKFLTLAFFTMCKSSALAFVLLFAFLFRLETPSVKLILIIATMTVGVIMMVAGETAFHALGFVLIISSAFFSGFRWALTQILLLRNPATSNPFSSIFFLAPVMFVSLAILAIPIEGFGPLKEGFGILAAAKGTFPAIGLLLFPGVLAFCMTSAEFALLKRTSVVTLSICGIFKEVITISAGGIVFHDELTPINVSGLIVTIASIAAYNYIKITKMRHDSREKLKEDLMAVEEEPMLDEEEQDDDEEGRTSSRRRVSSSNFMAGEERSSLTASGRISTEAAGEREEEDVDGGLARHSPSRKRAEDLE